ncbi:MAG: hypothetical protein ABUT20_09785 [Bacteroidota bacterium]
MKHSLPSEEFSVPHAKSLDELVGLLANSALPAAVRKKSFIVNDVPEKLNIAADENMLASVLSSLLHTVVSHADNSCIRIGADVEGNNVQVNVKDSSNNYHSVDADLQQVQMLAQKMSGYVSVSDRLEKSVTIAFRFPNMPRVA